MIKKNLQAILQGHGKAFKASFRPKQLGALETITREILKALKNGKKIFLCGNGGSAADAQHIAAEFIVRFRRDRRSLPAIALTTDTSILTSCANDYSYDQIFARQIEGLGAEGDLLILLSTSGKSPNILAALKQAKSQGLVTIGFSGGRGGELALSADFCYLAGSDKTAHIQEMYITALHGICEVVETVLFG